MSEPFNCNTTDITQGCNILNNKYCDRIIAQASKHNTENVEYRNLCGIAFADASICTKDFSHFEKCSRH